MLRSFALLVACLVMFATTGAHRAVASWFDAPAPAPIMTMDRAVEKSKTPCCKSYKVHKDHQASACSLPLVMLPATVQLTNRNAIGDRWYANADIVLRGQLCGPGEQPPKTA